MTSSGRAKAGAAGPRSAGTDRRAAGSSDPWPSPREVAPAGATGARIGVLALQGGFAAHAAALDRLGLAVREVRAARDLEGLDGLVLPGGESTTQRRLLDRLGLEAPLRMFIDSGRPVLATCAGLILLARQVEGGVPGLGALDVDVRRNAWGRQVASFEAVVDPEPARDHGLEGLAVTLIRAPRLVRLGPEVETVATWRGEAIAVRQGPIVAATAHPELGPSSALHALAFAGAPARA